MSTNPPKAQRKTRAQFAPGALEQVRRMAEMASADDGAHVTVNPGLLLELIDGYAPTMECACIGGIRRVCELPAGHDGPHHYRLLPEDHAGGVS